MSEAGTAQSARTAKSRGAAGAGKQPPDKPESTETKQPEETLTPGQWREALGVSLPLHVAVCATAGWGPHDADTPVRKADYTSALKRYTEGAA